MPTRRMFWLIPLLMAVHNAEKAVMTAREAPAQQSVVLPLLVAVGILAIVSTAVTAIALTGPPRSVRIYLLIALQGLMLCNSVALIWIALQEGAYQPGLASAIVVNLPFTWYCFRRAVRDGFVSLKPMLAVLLATIGIYAAWATVSGMLECASCAS